MSGQEATVQLWRRPQVSKQQKKKNAVVVKVKLGATPADLRLAVVRLRALSDRLMELAEKGEAIR